jgi:hypothetical protein
LFSGFETWEERAKISPADLERPCSRKVPINID